MKLALFLTYFVSYTVVVHDAIRLQAARPQVVQMATFNRQIDRKTIVVVRRTIDGHEFLDIEGLGDSPFVDPASVIEPDPVATALGASTTRVRSIFLQPQEDADWTSWRNLATALISIRQNGRVQPPIEAIATEWNAWIEKAIPGAALSVAQRRQVKGVADWVQAFHRLRLTSL
jgi:hypothetical protein